ncbi:hypothetical protein CGMCC3_g2103 [Colletotrichum fructicola]|uniref:Mitochondrial inner membrane protease subunit 1 n=1 Tax=Colletotrichum fructicola (strain Nara gc5) TaxID=1213859 RepID=A0A7J6JEE8_COLFN|nr:uncharacterized protein CGMCC3_g2103 [Colletotrichum fructicola]KAE9581655.1 hypothetical protein CGMCC3_g2103 [Colletotrichum fructicola]KAF4488686.1 Mitochondrial inner membrane protease subunit 1 [Colletotrichum fructicola Nara gc5]KAF5504192.1 Mitochondrial inner membrane protease subunit 1 [Colletotrichum fructicola]
MAAAHVFTSYCFEWGPAAGPSMLPTFDIAGDHIIVDKRYRYGRNIVVGDLVHYRIPIFQRAEGIKRVIGMPGDYVLVGSPDAYPQKMMQVPQELITNRRPVALRKSSSSPATGRVTWEIG